MRIALASLLVAFAAACSVPDINFTHDDGGTGGPDAMIDAPGEVMLVVSTNTLQVGEGGQGTFTVSLSAPPASAVLISIDSEDDNRAGVTPSSVSLDSTNWNQPRTITVSGREDADTENETVPVNVSSSVGDGVVTVTVNDNDDLSIVAQPAAGLDITEGESASITVHLSAQPSGTVTVNVMPSDTQVITTNPATLSFGTGTWDLDQTVVVTGVHDADTTSDTAMVTFSATGLDNTVVNVDVIDDDQLIIVPSTANLGVLAEGGTTTFTVRLNQQPPGDVTVNVMSSDTNVLTAGPAALAFDTVNWNTGQTVNVNVPQDVDVTDETATITLSATGLMPRTVNASIDDDDTQVVQVMPATVMMLEGQSRTVDVRLAFQPAADVSLSVTSLNPLLASAGPGTLTFTPANYDQPQVVTIMGVSDVDALSGSTSVRIESVADGLSRDVGVSITDDDQLSIDTSVMAVTLGEAGTTTFGVRLTAAPASPITVNTSSGDPTAATLMPGSLMFTPANYATFQMVTVTGVADVDLANDMFLLTLSASGVPNKTVDCTVTDDDMQVVVMTPPALSVNEGGTGTVGVSLGFMPGANVTVTVMSNDTNSATVSPGSVVFNAGNYNVPQNVTITGVNDADIVDETVMITGTAPGATGASVTVTVNDDDPLGIDTSVTTTNVGEAGTSMVGVRLTAQPPAGVTVMVTSSDPLAATAMPSSLNFTTANYDTFQQVTLTGVDDADAVNDNIMLSLMATGLTTRTVTVTVLDNDTQDILLTTPTVTLTEAGTATFGVHLAAMPATDVTVAVASANAAEATAAPTPLTFTPANYAANQMVTVTGVADLDLTNDMVSINMSSAGLTTRSVTATVNDVNMQEVLASSAGPFTLVEGGSAVSVGFSLRYIPNGSTTVTVTPGTGVTVMPASLVFNAGNHATVQNVMMTAVDDANAADVTTTVTASAPGATSAVVNVTVDDDEVLELDVSTTALTVGEGGSNTFNVRLTAQPLATTVVSIMSSDTNTATVTQASLSFTTADWNSFKSVTVNGVQDADLTNDGATVTVSATGMTSKNVGVTVNDDDMLTIQVATGSINVNEGSSGTVGVTLSHMPPASVVVSAVSGDTTAVSIPSASSMLTFTTANWNVAQNVTANAIQDPDAVAETVTITLTSGSTPNRTFTVTTVDDDVVLTDLSPQINSGTAGLAITVTGQGFVTGTTASIGGTALSGQSIMNATTITGTTPSPTGFTSRFLDARVTRGLSSSTIPRAFYNGQWSSGGTSMSGGDIRALATPPGSLTYAGTDVGVWRSINGGTAWTEASAGLPVGSPVHAIVTDPADPNRVWAGTNNGVYRSVDGGQQWAQAGLSGETIGCLAMAPNGSNMLACSASNRVFRSTDSGANWVVTIAGITDPNAAAWAPNSANAFVVSSLGVHRTLDTGSNWTLNNQGLPANPTALTVVAPMGSVIYVGTFSGVYRSQDQGLSWAQLGGVPATTINAITFSSQSTLFAAPSNGGLFKTTDSGSTWASSSSGLPALFSGGVRALSVRQSGAAPELWAGTSFWGVYRSANQGQSWSASTTGITAYDVFDLVVHPTTAGTAWMAPDGMGIWRTTDGGVSWSQSNGGLTGTDWKVNDLDITPDAPSTMWAAFNGGLSIRRSTDGGSTWSGTGLVGVGQTRVAAMNAQTVFAAGVGGIRRTLDGGTNWQLVNNNINGTNIQAIAVMGGQIWAAEGTSGVYFSSDNGNNWTSFNTGLPTNVRQLYVDLGDRIYAQTPSGTYTTNAQGTGWVALTTVATQSFAVDPAFTTTIYFGATSSGGVRRTINFGATTVPFSDGLPASTDCMTMAVDSTGTYVYCGTRNRGLFRLPPN